MYNNNCLIMLYNAFGKPYSNFTCCLFISCSWLHGADMDIRGGRKYAFNNITGMCNYLRLYISGIDMPIAFFKEKNDPTF